MVKRQIGTVDTIFMTVNERFKIQTARDFRTSRWSEAEIGGTMPWYAAHTIVSIRPIKRKRQPICVYENVILLEAADDNEADAKARKLGEASVVEDETLTLNGEPAVESFVGIRKIISVSNPWPLKQHDDRPVDGTEITYSEFLIKDEDTLVKLVNGKPYQFAT
jgi:hypothetical protein